MDCHISHKPFAIEIGLSNFLLSWLRSRRRLSYILDSRKTISFLRLSAIWRSSIRSYWPVLLNPKLISWTISKASVALATFWSWISIIILISRVRLPRVWSIVYLLILMILLLIILTILLILRIASQITLEISSRGRRASTIFICLAY